VSIRAAAPWTVAGKSHEDVCQNSVTCSPEPRSNTVTDQDTAMHIESYRVYRRVHSERGMDPMSRPSKYSPELRERAVRMVLDHAPDHPSQWAAIRSVAEKLGCTVEALRRWVRQSDRDAGTRPDALPTWSIAGSRRRGRISCGSRTSPTSPRGAASST
jgi:transposase-like protein